MPLLDIQTALRRQGQNVSLDRLRTVLDDRQTFTALANDCYMLRSTFDAQLPPEADAPTVAGSYVYLQNLAVAQDTYVVLDLETSGLNADDDQIIQVAALLVEHGTATTFRSWYVQCDPARLGAAIRATLHLTDALVARIAVAPGLVGVAQEVRAFIGARPLVIHNARFDTKFLVQIDITKNAVVDTMELALLMLPHAPQHRLSAVAESLGIVLEAIPVAGIAGVPAGYAVGADTLHNAVTDVLVLAAVYRELLRRWHAAPTTVAALRGVLLPECAPTGTTPHADLLDLVPLPVLAPRRAAGLVTADAAALLQAVAAREGLEPRPSQHSMVERIGAAFAQDTSLMIEAPTGTGKTLGYLVPAVWEARRTGRRIALATAYKNLQDQLRGEVERVRAIVPFDAQVLKGASAYLCLRDLQHAIDSVEDADLDRRYVLAFMALWASEAPNATLDELPYWLRSTFAVTDGITADVVVDRQTCTERRCPFYDRCPMFTAYRRAEQADIVLINQALWLSEPAMMPPFDALVIDEAHNLEDVATNALREDVGDRTLGPLLARLAVPGTRRGLLQRILDRKPNDDVRGRVHLLRRSIGQSLQLLADVGATLGTFVEGCDERLDLDRGAHIRLTGPPERIYPTRWNVVRQALDQLWRVYVADIRTNVAALLALLPADDEGIERGIDAVLQRIDEQSALLMTILQGRRLDYVSWIDVQRVDGRVAWSFSTAPVSVAPMLADRYNALRSVVLTSATLTTGPHNFSFFMDRLGLRGRLGTEDALALDGALPYAENVMLGIPSYLSYAPAQTTITSYVEELSREFALLFQYTEGRALALFTARTRLEQVAGHVAAGLEAHGILPLVQGNSSRQRLVELFREHGHAVLFGLKSFWEGVDIPGAALSFVVMEKLPYPAFNDPIHQARRELLAWQSGREFQDYLFPLMVLQFKQGFGRLVRRPTDRGAVLVYDKRVARKSYLPDLLGALPGYQSRDVVAERSRRSFYELLAERFPDLIDRAAHDDLIATLPDVLGTSIEDLVERLALPDPIPDDEYDQWRPRILEGMQALFGYGAFRSSEQEAAMRAMLTGRDVLAVLPTGAGKSMCFQLPALLRSGTTLVCSPLIALMRDQIDKLHERGIEIAAVLVSGQSAAEREEVLLRLRAGGLRLLYLAPERLRDPVVRAALAAAPIRQIVVDEAHCVALWGPSFRPDFLVLPHIYALLAHRPAVAAFTATATPEISTAIISSLHLHDPQIVRAPIDRPELRLVVFDRKHRYHAVRSKTDQIRRLLLLVQVAAARNEAMLSYVATTKEAEHIARLLQVAGYGARAYHGKMPIQERATVGELFMDDLLSIVVCTKAFGMGIDKPDIRYVVHFHIPGDLESYAQEVGRAGRDGTTAYGILLHHPSDEQIQQFFIDQGRPDGALLQNLWRWIGTQPPTFVLDPNGVVEQFDTDDLALRRALYLLEQAGLIRRDADVTVRGNLTLLGTWDEVATLVPVRHQALFDQLAVVLPSLGWSPQEVVLADIARDLACDATLLETALVDLAVAGGCIYRPWERGYQIVRVAAVDTTVPPIGTDIVMAQERKLAKMRTFVHSPVCRWQELRRYFGDAVGEPCGICDRCDPEQAYPWSGKTGRDVPDVSDFVDLGTTFLELVAWNERRSRERGSPFGTTTLLRILRGDEYTLMRFAPPGPAADARRQTLRSCPFWGICRTLRRSEAELQHLVQRLIDGAYLSVTEARSGEHTYSYLMLTTLAHDHLASGERLDLALP